MKNKKPPFEITNQMISYVAEIAELVGKLSAVSSLSANPTLRRSNRICTIHGSLAIEQNTLSLEQVTAVLSGKHVLASPKDIAEVKNAYEIYDRLEELDPYSVYDLHHDSWVDGEVRCVPFSSCGRCGQRRACPAFWDATAVCPPHLVIELLDWARNSEVHMLIRSCVFHYELELIHPFADGNGRVGRLWHTLLLSKWNSAFAWLPVDSIIHDHQREYYEAINASNNVDEFTVFIEFMLSAIKVSLIDVISASDEMSHGKRGKATLRQNKIQEYLKTHDYIMNADVRELCGVSAATANRTLSMLTIEGKLVKYRCGGHWAYHLAV